MVQVAVIGGGAAGIGAAETLIESGMEVRMLEASARLGGNCRAVEFRDSAGEVHTVDAGVSDYNRATFVEFSRLIDRLGLETRPIVDDVNFVSVDGRSLWSHHGGRWRPHATPFDASAIAAEIARFREHAGEVLEDRRYTGWTAERYLDRLGLSASFRAHYFYPRAMGCFPMPNRDPREFGIRSLVRFWAMHGLVGRARSDRRCIVGGMHRYPRAWRERYLDRGGVVHCGTRVLAVERGRRRVSIHAIDARGHRVCFEVDHVVFATHAREALSMLDEPTLEERVVLSSFRARWAQVVVHRSPRFAGSRRADWGAFNYVVPGAHAMSMRPTITFHPNRLASLDPGVPPVFVTLNPHTALPPSAVIARGEFLHPVATAEGERHVNAIGSIQGRLRAWYAGAYLASPFVHESALRSGIEVAQGLVEAESTSRPVRAHVA